MGFFTGMKAAKAYNLQGKGQTEEARKLYEECFAEGLDTPRYVLSYAVLLIRSHDYQTAKDLLVKYQKAPGITPDQKINLFTNYAVCCFKLGETDKGISILERQHHKQTVGLIYETLGCLYVEKYALTNTPDFDALEAAAAQTAALEPPAEDTPVEGSDEAIAETSTEPAPSPRDIWQEGLAKARAYCEEAVDYDDEDPICLDNMGQFLYRCVGDKEAAKPWFEKAIAVKPAQIDTLYFLSRYDLEAGDQAAAKEKLEKAMEGRFSPLNYASKDLVQAELNALA